MEKVKDGRIGFNSYVSDYLGCGTLRIIYPSLLLNNFKYKNNTFLTAYNTVMTRDAGYYNCFMFNKLQRVISDNILLVIKDLEKYDIKFIYEVDDMLFNIPKWNFASDYYAKNEDNIKEIMSRCHGMTVSTEYLKNRYSMYNENIVVIPNLLPHFIWGDIVLKKPSKKIKILWSGSENHFSFDNEYEGDFSKKLINFIHKTHKEYDWVLMGSYPKGLDLNKIEFIPFAIIHEYPNILKKISPDICIAPLLDVEFNKSKSNIKMLEYTALGCASIYSDIEPYKKAYIKAKNTDEMIEKIKRLAKDPDLRSKVWEENYNVVKDKLWLENNLHFYVNEHLKLYNMYL